ncbi:alpha/beta hydrolase family protein [Actinoalloteichus caeruleus]|uniref:alpha/beta hydrolase family protein n=1 Tax=Actinoalloteichus cyanogriseus TaxID=2893586 RepID=UPI003AAB62E6
MPEDASRAQRASDGNDIPARPPAERLGAGTSEAPAAPATTSPRPPDGEHAHPTGTRSRGARRARSGRRRRVLFVSLGAVVVLGVTGLLGVGWYYTEELLTPVRYSETYPEVVRGADEGSVLLADSPAARSPGTTGLFWSEGTALLGDPTPAGDGLVARELVAGTPPAAGTPARLDREGWRDPGGLGLDYREVAVTTEVGEAPAWLVPAEDAASTWAVLVHGRGADRAEGLRVLPTLQELGIPGLLISYRNDEIAPASEDGLYHLGHSEWRDVVSAMEFAVDEGAERIVLVGFSMGGALVGQTLGNSELAERVDAVVLDAPVLNWSTTLDLEADNRGMPKVFGRVAELVAGWRTGLSFADLDLLTNPPERRPATLLLHGDEDLTVPVGDSRALAAAADSLDWPVEYHEFPGAEHVASWNQDRNRYEEVVREFLTRTTGR